MEARQIKADEADIIRRVHDMVSEVTQDARWRCSTEPIVVPIEKLEAAAADHTGAGLFVAFDEQGEPQGVSITRPGRTSLLVCRSVRFDEAAKAVLAEARRVKGPGDGRVENDAIRARLQGLPGVSVRVDDATRRVTFD